MPEPAATDGPPEESPWAGSLELHDFAPQKSTTTAVVRGFSASPDVASAPCSRI